MSHVMKKFCPWVFAASDVLSDTETIFMKNLRNLVFASNS